MRPYLALCLASVLLAGCDAFDFERVVGPLPSASPSAAAPQRAPAPSASAAARAERLVVIVGGDVNLAGGVRSFVSADAKYNPLAGLDPVLEEAALRLSSLVSPLSAKPGPKPQTAVGPAEGAAALARAHLDAVALANDALLAVPQPIFDETVSLLSAAKVARAGTAPSEKQPPAPLSLEARGWKIALVDGTIASTVAGKKAPPGRVASFDATELGKVVREARGTHDVVLVLQRGGTQFAEAPGADETARARAALEAGADAFIGRGARVPRGVAWYDGRPAFYDLGNLIADEDAKNPWTARGLLVRITFAPGAKPVTDLCPYLIADGEPKLLSGPGRATQEGIFRRAIDRLSAPLGALDIGEPDLHSCMRVSPRP